MKFQYKFLVFSIILIFIWPYSAEIRNVEDNNGYINLIETFFYLSFNSPVDFQSPDDSENKLYVVEQAGKIIRFDNDNETRLSDVFLDITDQVLSGGERGLLGLAFHPKFVDNGYFYLDYTSKPDGKTVISRFSVSDIPNIADKSSELIIISIDQPYRNHNAGGIAFGLDGYLYIALGDGGSSGDPSGNAQNKKTLLGSILRLNVDFKENGMNYSIPSDNPFKNNLEGFKEEIFAYGLRNPWRISVDSMTGDIWAGDVGQNKFEEIDLIKKGGNYGWNIMEGFSCYNSENCNETNLEQPLVEYGRNDGKSVTGGYIYRGLLVEDLIGKYLYADFYTGKIWQLVYDFDVHSVNNSLIFETNLQISSFGTDNKNELYIVAYSGKIYKFISSASFQNNSSILKFTTNQSSNLSASNFSLIPLTMLVLLIKAKKKLTC